MWRRLCCTQRTSLLHHMRLGKFLRNPMIPFSLPRLSLSITGVTIHLQYCCMMSDFGVQFEIYIFTMKLWRTQNNLCMLFLERPPITPQDCKFFIIVINYFLIQYLKSHTHCFEKFGFYMDFEVNQCLFEQTLAVNGIAITGISSKFFFWNLLPNSKKLTFLILHRKK